MRSLCLSLAAIGSLWGVAAVCGAEPPATCNLAVVRLAPWLPGTPCPENERLLRFVRGQQFHFGRSNANPLSAGAVEYQEQKAREFAEAVHKEPGSYCSEFPFRAAVTLGGHKFGFVLDKQAGTSRGYDRLYFDVNGNGDLTDDAPIDIPETERISESTGSANDDVHAAYVFPPVDLTLRDGESEWEYSFYLTVRTTVEHNFLNVSAHFTPAIYRQGEITLQGKTRKILLVDWNVSGRFDVPVTFSADGNGVEGFFGQYGTEIIFDPDTWASKHFEFAQTSQHRQYLAQMNALDGEYYHLKVRPGGDELTCEPADVPLGKIAAPHAPLNVWLIGEQGFLALDLQDDAPVDIPAGMWRLLYCAIGYTAKDGASQESTDSAGPAKYLTASCDASGSPISVVAGQTTRLNLGPPYTPTMSVSAQNQMVTFGLDVRGVGHEKLTFGGAPPSRPTVTITDPKGKVVCEGQFEYG